MGRTKERKDSERARRFASAIIKQLGDDAEALEVVLKLARLMARRKRKATARD